jgi:putative membrane protein
MKQTRAELFFTDAEKEKIRNAVESVEATTSGEIATWWSTAATATEAEIFGAVLTAGLIALIIEVLLEYIVVTSGLRGWRTSVTKVAQIFLHGISVWRYIPGLFPRFFHPEFVQKIRDLNFLSWVEGELKKCRERAVRAFFEKEPADREETGVLTFISILSTRSGYHDRIDRKIPVTLWRVRP